jgi:hypothetical protein
MKSREEMLSELVSGGGFIGFGLAKLEKAIWVEDHENDKVTACPYKWTIYHKNGFIEVDEGKIDKFWRLMGVPKGEGRGIIQGPVGYHNTGIWDWQPVASQEEWDDLMDTWMDKYTAPTSKEA